MALKIVYPICCGIDVLVACIASPSARGLLLTSTIAFLPIPNANFLKNPGKSLHSKVDSTNREG
ncbi:hypothetical protein KNH48_14670 [Heyndrickxia coagulans]|nr:hypothetical protein KNH48_14670 [Heyndrickxia coagulans]